MKAYFKRKKQKLVILSIAAAILVGVGINCSKLNRFDFDIGGVNWNKNDTIEFEHIEKYSGYENVPPQNYVIKDTVEWNAFLSTLNPSGNLARFLPNYSIDFSTHQILAVFDEIRNDGVWGIEISNIVEQACHIVVTYHTWKKISKYGGWQAYHLVKIPASNKQVVFQEEFDNEVDNVPYASCPLESNDTVFLRGVAYLFRDSMPYGQWNKDGIMNILYYTTSDTVLFYSKYVSIYLCLYHPATNDFHYDGFICNFPNFAKSWNIPPEGRQIYFKGIFFETIYPKIEFSAGGHLILRTLKDTIN